MSGSNAWSRGRPVMPPTSNTRGPPPGLRKSTQPTLPSDTRAQPDIVNSPALYNRERYLHLLLSMVGHSVTIHKTNGEVIEGIFHTFCPFEGGEKEKKKNVYVVKGTKMIRPANDTTSTTSEDTVNNNINGNSKTFQEGSTVLVSSTHVSKVHIKSLRLDTSFHPNDDMFRTDAEISGQRGGNERLIAAGSVWTSAGDNNQSGGLEATTNTTTSSTRGGMFQSATTNNNNTNPRRQEKPTGLSGSIGDWDQFSANEKRFNVKASFDENLYTTALDYTTLDSSKLAEAERIASEIENTTSTNIHIMEERNQKISADYDEEDLYSGVLKKKEDEKPAKTMNYAAAAGAGKKVVEKTITKDVEMEGVSDEGKEVVNEVQPENEKKKEEEKSKSAEEKEGSESKPKLNPNAKEFTFNPSAKSFTPSFGATPAAPPAPVPMEYPGGAMHPGMMGGNYHPGMQYMQPGVPGMMPAMNAQHPQMRQPYAPYGGAPPGQPVPSPTPGQEDASSVATGEGSSNPAETQPPGQQQQYIQPGYAPPPGSYPGYYGGAAAAAMMHHHPHQRPGGFHPPPQMHMPGGGYQRVYPGMMQQMRGPPQPYGYGGGGGAPGPYPGYNGDGEGNKFQRKNIKGGGNGGNYKNKRNSYNGGRGGGGAGRGYHNNPSEGRNSDESPTQDGSGSDYPAEEADKVVDPIETTAS